MNANQNLNNGTTDMQPVFSPEALGVATPGVRFRDALERLSVQGELKAKLLLVALDHFAKRGFDGVQVREVAEEAGVSKPTLYYHFGSKEGLFRQLCLVAQAVVERRVVNLVEPLLESVPMGAVAIRASAMRLAKGYVELLRETPEFTGFIFRSIAVPSPDSGFRDLMPLVERALSPFGLYIHTVFGVSLEQARKEVLIFTAIFGALIEEGLRRPEYVIDDQELDWAVDRWLRGLEPVL